MCSMNEEAPVCGNEAVDIFDQILMEYEVEEVVHKPMVELEVEPKAGTEEAGMMDVLSGFLEEPVEVQVEMKPPAKEGEEEVSMLAEKWFSAAKWASEYQMEEAAAKEWCRGIWTMSGKTDPLQNAMAAEISEKWKTHGALVNLPVGAGKTRTAIEACRLSLLQGFRVRMQTGKPGLCVMMVPNAVLSQWKSEWNLMYPDVPVWVLHSMTPRRLEEALNAVRDTPGVRVVITTTGTALSMYKHSQHCKLYPKGITPAADKAAPKKANKSKKTKEEEEEEAKRVAALPDRFVKEILLNGPRMVVDEVHQGTRNVANVMCILLSKVLEVSKVGLSATPILNDLQSEVIPLIQSLHPHSFADKTKLEEDEMDLLQTIQDLYIVTRSAKELEPYVKRHERDTAPYYVPWSLADMATYHHRLTECQQTSNRMASILPGNVLYKQLMLRLFRQLSKLRMVNACTWLDWYLSDKRLVEDLCRLHQKLNGGEEDKEELVEEEFLLAEGQEDKQEEKEDEEISDLSDSEDEEEEEKDPYMKMMRKQRQHQHIPGCHPGLCPISIGVFHLLREALAKPDKINPSTYVAKLAEVYHSEHMRKSHQYRATFELLMSCHRSKKKTLVFSEFPSMFDLLQEGLIMEGYRAEILTGQMSAAQREQSIQAWKLGHSPLFLLSTKAAGVGLNFPEAERILFLTMPMNPATYEQVVGRADRRDRTLDKIEITLVSGVLDTMSTRFTTHVRKQADMDLLTEKSKSKSKKSLGAANVSLVASLATRLDSDAVHSMVIAPLADDTEEAWQAKRASDRCLEEKEREMVTASEEPKPKSTRSSKRNSSSVEAAPAKKRRSSAAADPSKKSSSIILDLTLNDSMYVC